MKKKLMIAAAVAAIASVPAITGLVGNASFAQSVPVHVPAGARLIDDHGRQAEPGDDRSGTRHSDRASSTRGSDDSPAPGTMTSDDGGSGHGGHEDGAADQ
jgi:hypothetical protein